MKNYKVLILTFNDQCHLAPLLQDLEEVNDVVIIDSFSTDGTLEIAKQFGRQVYQHSFKNQATQVMWAVETLFSPNDWILRLDSDERISEALLLEIENSIQTTTEDFVGYLNREMYWMGKKLHYATIRNHYIARLWKPKDAFYEDVAEEHLIHSCSSKYFGTKFYENNKKNNIEYFIQKHLLTGKQEVLQLTDSTHKEEAKLFTRQGHFLRRWLKINLYNRLPIFSRAVLYFIYRYIFKLGFLDGREGFSFCFFQAFFYRMLIDQMSFEKANKEFYE